MSDIKLLETFPNPRPGRDYLIEHTFPEFTSVCPKTGQPDFATMVVSYVADKECLELKSLKFYMNAYRNEGIFYEAVTNKILDDLVAACKPRSMKVISKWGARGGFSSIITVEHSA
ncbi:MAG: preQ(1) synthase [Verrucomicrobia bacterium]|nr:preQ(1) synthase [Verrucomicrobiota bacterium]